MLKELDRALFFYFWIYFFFPVSLSAIMDFFVICGRIHLQKRIENEEQCHLLVKELREEILQAYPAEIQDREVLHEDYIKRVLQLRKVTIETFLWIYKLHLSVLKFRSCNLKWYIWDFVFTKLCLEMIDFPSETYKNVILGMLFVTVTW